LGGAEVKISFLELFDSNIGPKGAKALGMSLSYGHNLSLLTLKLDYNGTLGDEGVAHLCKGLRTNQSLKQLHLQFCGITAESGPHLAEVLANSRSELEVVNVSGNRMGGAGLLALCVGLQQNVKLETLSLGDNMIDQMEEDMAGLTAFKNVLLIPSCALTSVDLMYNRIGEAGANILIEAMGPENTKIKEFLVDLTLPMPIFEALFRKGGGKGKKGGKAKKGKKK
jgi:Ran GTPase-activating protein (RanGAP) involved in mRNA processing and transport